jgi:hypothetical protein
MATQDFNSINFSSPFFSQLFTEFNQIGCVFHALQETQSQILSGKVTTIEQVKQLLSELSGLIKFAECRH